MINNKDDEIFRKYRKRLIYYMKKTVIIIASACMIISGCGYRGEKSIADAGSDFSQVGDYEVRIPTMINTALKEDYDDIDYLNHSFYKKSGLLKSLELGWEKMGTCEFHYDADGRLVEENFGWAVYIHINYNEKGLPDAYVYETDENGYVIEARALADKVSESFSDRNYGIYTRNFKNYENGLIESFSETEESKHSDNDKADNYKVSYDIYGDIISIKGKSGTRTFSYMPYVDRPYSKDERDELLPATEWKTFAECSIIPTPDSCINTIKKDESIKGNGYTYLLPGKSDLQIRNQLTIGYYNWLFGAYCSKPEGSDEIYYEYISILKDVLGLELTVDDNGNTLISDSKGERIGVLCYKQVKGKGSCLEVRFI